MNQPEITMPEGWWQILASMHEMIEEKQPSTIGNIANHLGVTRDTAQNRIIHMEGHSLTEREKTDGSALHYPTDYGYAQLTAFCDYVENEEQAEKFYSRQLKKLSA